MNARLFFVHALSPLHAGTGQGIDVIDLPIAREKATGIPFLPGSSLKGPLRDRCSTGQNSNMCDRLFGRASDNDSAQSTAGSAQFSDARLLLLPVRTLVGTFAWVTSPYVLHRFMRDAHDANINNLPHSIPQPVLNAESSEGIVFGNDSLITMPHGNQQQIILEDLDLRLRSISAEDDNQNWAAWLGRTFFPDSPSLFHRRFCIVHDTIFDFLLKTATEITARISMEATTKTANNLWYEESLPTESILTGLIVYTPVRASDLSDAQVFETVTSLMDQTIQLGGKATVGRGLCRVGMIKEAKKDENA
ncbi:MAG: type III-B CRISPR module RAMP protein Cmr4 [Herpetosiphonaceae bacterium]|nr:type III-B CRISPR module RAMP protein Cmr4 [Herpetosiphonaceae bacterium]